MTEDVPCLYISEGMSGKVFSTKNIKYSPGLFSITSVNLGHLLHESHTGLCANVF